MDQPLEAELSAEVARLLTEHQRYSLRLHQLVAKPYLSVEEQMEEVRLKKLKLHAKDLISAIQMRVTTQGPASHAGASQAQALQV
jgi:uncharacterized protein YdcH (DUF465 family)